MEPIGVVANKHDKLAENRLKMTKSKQFFSVKSENLKNAGNGLKCIEKQNIFIYFSKFHFF